MRLIFLFLWVSFLNAHDNHKITPEAFDFQNEDAGFETYYTDHYSQMEIYGDHLYLCHRVEPFILQIHLETREVKKIGKKGSGPGEFPLGVKSMAVGAKRIWAVDSANDKKILSFSLSGKYLKSLAIPRPGPRRYYAANSIAFNNRELLVPISPGSGALAQVIQFDGGQQVIGELPIPRNEMNTDLIQRIPYINQSFWVWNNNNWYAAFAYQPVILKYDRNFKLVNSYQLEHPLIQERFNKILEFSPERPGMGAPFLVTDMKIFRDRLYAMCAENYLFELDLANGAILSVSRFTHLADELEKGGGKPVSRPLFAFDSKGVLYLGHPAAPIVTNHDLFIVKNPPFFKDQKTMGQ